MSTIEAMSIDIHEQTDATASLSASPALPSAPEDGQERPTWTITLPPGWARAGLAGIEAALLGWMIPAIFFALVYLAVSANVWIQGITAGEATAIGTDFWASSLGSPLTVAGIPITFVPLLWTGVQVVALRALLLQSRTFGAAALWTAVPAFTLTALLLVGVAGESASLLWTGVGALLVSTLGTMWAVVRQTYRYYPWVHHLAWVWSGVRTGVWWLVTVAVASLVAVLVTIGVAWSDIRAESQLLGATGTSEVFLFLWQLMYLPVFMAWALAWASGAGFTLGGGTFSSALVSIPADHTVVFPFATAVPTVTPGAWAVWLTVGVGLALGIITASRQADLLFTDAIRRNGVACGIFTVGISAWMWTATGSLGIGQLAHLGPTRFAWLIVSVMVGGVAFVAALVAHPDVRHGLRVLIRRSGGPDEGGNFKEGVESSSSAEITRSEGARTEARGEGAARTKAAGTRGDVLFEEAADSLTNLPRSFSPHVAGSTRIFDFDVQAVDADSDSDVR